MGLDAPIPKIPCAKTWKIQWLSIVGKELITEQVILNYDSKRFLWGWKKSSLNWVAHLERQVTLIELRLNAAKLLISLQGKVSALRHLRHPFKEWFSVSSSRSLLLLISAKRRLRPSHMRFVKELTWLSFGRISEHAFSQPKINLNLTVLKCTKAY